MFTLHLWHGKEAIPHRYQRCAVEADRTIDTSGQAGRSSTHDRHAGGDERHLLHHTGRLWLANAAARFSQVANRLRVLLLLAGRRHLGDHERSAPRAGTSPGQTEVRTSHWRARQSERQDVGPGRRARVRRGKKRSTEESGTCSLTRWDWCSVVWSTRRACRIVTGRSGSWPERHSTSPACGSFARTQGTPVAWSAGCVGHASGRWRSSAAPQKALWSCPNDGSWNARSPGWESTAGCQRTTKFSKPPVKHSSTSP